MKILSLLFFTLALSAPALAESIDHLSYGQLAAHVIRPSWEKTNYAFNEVSSTSLPHEVKDVRKQIAQLKEQLDLFVYAYPDEPEDQWNKIRKLLDDGYEAFGDFKDLYDIQDLQDTNEAEYDPSELRTSRKALLNWLKKWNADVELNGSYISRPDTRDFYSRKKKQLSRFYWGSTELEPDSTLTGVQNLAALALALRDSAINDWSSVRNVENPADSTEAEEAFHDFRKRIRSLSRILRSFPSIYAGQEENLLELEALASEYGEIQDKIVAHEKATKRGNDKKARKLYQQVGKMWQELLQRQQERGVKKLLKSVLIH